MHLVKIDEYVFIACEAEPFPERVCLPVQHRLECEYNMISNNVLLVQDDNLIVARRTATPAGFSEHRLDLGH